MHQDVFEPRLEVDHILPSSLQKWCGHKEHSQHLAVHEHSPEIQQYRSSQKLPVSVTAFCCAHRTAQVFLALFFSHAIPFQEIPKLLLQVASYVPSPCPFPSHWEPLSISLPTQHFAFEGGGQAWARWNMDLIQMQKDLWDSLQSVFDPLGTAFPFCFWTHCIPAAFSLHPGRGGGERGGLFFSQSRFGRCTVPVHGVPLPLCLPSPRAAPDGHNKRLASLFQLVANHVA